VSHASSQDLATSLSGRELRRSGQIEADPGNIIRLMQQQAVNAASSVYDTDRRGAELALTGACLGCLSLTSGTLEILSLSGVLSVLAPRPGRAPSPPPVYPPPPPDERSPGARGACACGVGGSGGAVVLCCTPQKYKWHQNTTAL
jgi:hypothetical protein